MHSYTQIGFECHRMNSTNGNNEDISNITPSSIKNEVQSTSKIIDDMRNLSDTVEKLNDNLIKHYS